MTWTKLSDDFGDRAARLRLTDAAFRTHVKALLWVMRRETGGRLDRRDLRRFAESPDVDRAAKELLDCGAWRTDGHDGFEVVLGMGHQVEPEVLRERRETDARRQRELRKRKSREAAQRQDRLSRRDEPSDVQAVDRRDPGRDGTGLGRPEGSLHVRSDLDVVSGKNDVQVDDVPLPEEPPVEDDLRVPAEWPGTSASSWPAVARIPPGRAS